MEYESKLTDIIASLPEVDGGFLYDTTRGIYSNQTSGTVDDSSLLQVSTKLSKIVSMLAVHFHDTGGIRVTFKDLILFGLMFEENNWLFLFHHPSLSPGMVKMTVQMALNIKVEEQAQAPPHSEGAKESLLDVLMNDESELKEPLITIQNELANHIGPVAELVFIDAIDEWSEFSPPSLETLPELLGILDNEIDDEEASILFKENLKSYSGATE